jgi:16S rRNA (uracil1498-N3)-methyltransferase
MRRFYIDRHRIDENKARLSGQDTKHLRDVLRLCTGDQVRLFDGTGCEYIAEISGIILDEVILNVLTHEIFESQSPVRITLAQAFLKDKKMDTLVRQVSELGIDRWLPFQASRSVARPDGERLKARKERWIKIVREALKQCGRSKLPEICDTVSFGSALSLVKDCDLKIIFWEKSANPISDLLNMNVSKADDPIKSVCIVMGPEGGFEDFEVKMAMDEGFIPLSLGPRILKADTASIAACTLIQHLFGDME